MGTCWRSEQYTLKVHIVLHETILPLIKYCALALRKCLENY